MKPMTTKHLSILIAGALSVLPTLANADSPGLYIGLGAGVTLPRQSDVEAPGIDTNADLDNGWKGIGSVGYKFTNGIRSELELGYGSNQFDKIADINADGSILNRTAMLNAFYDFNNVMPWSMVTPFVGLGLGVDWVKIRNATIPGLRVDDSDLTFAYQAMAGLNFDITNQLSANIGYRWFHAPSFDVTSDTGGRVETNYSAHMFLVGMRWSFGAPARPAPVAAPTPAAQPAPAPAPRAQVPSRYLVFFEFDRADLTPEGRQVVQQAATASKTNNVVRLEVTGHADRSGSDAYNQRLSQRRAETVRTELVRNGVREADIAVFAKGEREPLVPTPDGVREPQNRRVEIVFK